MQYLSLSSSPLLLTFHHHYQLLFLVDFVVGVVAVAVVDNAIRLVSITNDTDIVVKISMHHYHRYSWCYSRQCRLLRRALPMLCKPTRSTVPNLPTKMQQKRVAVDERRSTNWRARRTNGVGARCEANSTSRHRYVARHAQLALPIRPIPTISVDLSIAMNYCEISNISELK